MADNVTMFGDISPRTAGYTVKKLLERALPNMIAQRFGQQKPMPMKYGKIQKFRRYLSLAASTAPLAEGVTPDAQRLTYEDVLATINQYGSVVKITDVIEDLHEDPVLMETKDLLAEEVQEVIEKIDIAVLKAGTNVRYANGALRTSVNTVFDRGDLRYVVRQLRANKAKYFTQIVKATPNYATEPVGASFWAMCHTDLEADIRNLDGFVSSEKYSESEKAIPYELGKCESVRFVTSPLFTPWLAGGAAIGSSGMIAADSTTVDVYPIVIVAPDAYGLVPLKGKNAMDIKILSPGKPDKADPLGQIGYAGWITWHTAVILQDNFMYRIETGATNNPT